MRREKIDPYQTIISQTLIPYMPDIVKPLYKGLALYLQNHGLSSLDMQENCRKFWEIRNNFVILFKRFEKI